MGCACSHPATHPSAEANGKLRGSSTACLSGHGEGLPNIEPARALQWLRLRNSYSSGYGGGQSDDLRSAIRERKDRLSAITDHFFETLMPESDRWLRLTPLS